MTKVELELIKDPNIYLLFENVLRGGVSTVRNQFATVNNKYLDNYDSPLPTSHVLSTDVVNLYGFCMLSKLPCGNFRFLDNPESFAFQSFDVDSDTGYTLEVDLVYPQEHHDTHLDLPLAPDPMKVTPNMLSDYNADMNFVGHKFQIFWENHITSYISET